MNEYELEILLKEKKYPNDLIAWAIKFYPIMCDYFGTDNTNSFLREYTFIPRGISGKSSGVTHREEKKIGFDWIRKNLHEALTLFIHEAAHAIGGLSIHSDSILMEGHKSLESFFAKLEEGLVSDKQNEMEFGELLYTYVAITIDDDEYHKNDFKTQPSHKYTINNLYYRALQLLLGDNKDLLVKMMFAKDENEKNNYFNSAISFLKEQLTNEEMEILMDCACGFTLNYGYHGNTASTSQYLNDTRNFKTEKEKEDYIRLLQEIFPKNYSYAQKRNLLGKKIYDSVDDLCSLLLNVLIRRLESDKYDRFSAIKEACTYFVKIDNNNQKLTQKTNKLKEVLLEKINELFPQFAFIDFKKYSMTDDDQFTIITQIISLRAVTNENTNITFNYNDQNLSFSVNDSESYIVRKEDVYSDDKPFILPITATPIGYKIVVEKEKTLENVSNHSLT